MIVCRQLPLVGPRPDRDRGDTMLMTVVLMPFLVMACWALIAGVEAWGHRRDVHGAASAGARAAVQVDADEVLSGRIDQAAAQRRVDQVLAGHGVTGSVTVGDWSATVSVSATVSYGFPAPGFPTSMSATSSATAVRSVTGGSP